MTPPRRSRAARRLSIALVVLAAGVGVGGELVEADAPLKQGWWSKKQTAPVATAPGVPEAGVAPTPATVPPPPTGDEGGLTVAHGPEGPEAVAAMFFETEPGLDGTLYLPAAPRKKAGTPDPQPPSEVDLSTTPAGEPDTSQAPHPDAIVLPPGATVLACRATSPWARESNAPFSRAPRWATDDCVPGTRVAADTAMFWTLPATMQNADGNYDIVLVPTAPPPQPPPPPPHSGVGPDPGLEPQETPEQAPESSYMVNFGSPGSDTLVTDELPDEETPEDPPDDEEGPDDEGGDDGDSGDELLLAGPIDVPGPDATYLATPTRTRAPVATLAASRDRRTPRLLPFPDTRLERIMAVSLLLFIALALWWLGGSPTRMPRLIGAVAGRTGGAAPAMPLLRGVGRFARERLGRPPRL